MLKVSGDRRYRFYYTFRPDGAATYYAFEEVE